MFSFYLPVELVLWTMLSTTPHGLCSFEMLESGGPAGSICWYRLTHDLTPTRFSNEPSSELSRSWQAAMEGTLPRTAADIVTERTPLQVTQHSLSGIGSAGNDNYLVIRKRQQAEAFCEIASYSPHVPLGMHLWDICKRKAQSRWTLKCKWMIQVENIS